MGRHSDRETNQMHKHFSTWLNNFNNLKSKTNKQTKQTNKQTTTTKKNNTSSKNILLVISKHNVFTIFFDIL